MNERIKKVVKPAAIVLAIGFSYLLLHTVFGFSIPCPVHLTTGLYCPGCGVSRMFFSIFKLDFISAFKYNPVIFCALPVFSAMFIYHNYRYLRFGKKGLSKWENILLYIFIGILVVFGVLRNIFPIG
ncbi:MAG: DUF2752 domain-containing protein [Ruminococcus sp.]|nr:DUF2752 domain-containing protein [Ruminococcus sp.]